MELTFYVRGSKSSGKVQVLPRVTLEEGEIEFPPGTVNLSRSGENPDCWLGLEELWRHDGHAPGFEGREQACEYMERIVFHTYKLLSLKSMNYLPILDSVRKYTMLLLKDKMDW